MTLRPRMLGALLLTGCVGGSMTQRLSGPSTAPAPDAFACVRDQLKAVGFSQSSYDTEALRVTARKFNETVRRPDVTFRRLVDRLELEVQPGSGTEMSRIVVDAKTFGEFVTQRGPTELQEATSETARAAAQTIIDKCGATAAVDSTRVPE
jgi:hypothetical protein